MAAKGNGHLQLGLRRLVSSPPDPRATTPPATVPPESSLRCAFPRFLTPAFDSIRLGIETSSGQNSLLIPAIPLLPQNSLHFSPAPLAQVYSPQPAAAPPTLHILESAIPDNPVETSLPQKPLFFSAPPIRSIPAVPVMPPLAAPEPPSPSSSYVGSPVLDAESVGTWRESDRQPHFGDHKKKEVLEGVVDGQIVRSVV